MADRRQAAGYRIGATTIPQAIAAAAGRWPDREAIVDGARRIDFGALADAVARAASVLRDYGVSRGVNVALWAPNSADWIVACAAVQALGAAVVPINSRLKGAEAAGILRRTRAKLLLTVAGFAGQDYPTMIAGHDLPHLATTVLLDDDWRSRVAAAAQLEAVTEADDLADIIFTSGTTGAPKGVMATHAQNVATAESWASAVGLTAGDRYLLVNPFFHCFGYKAGWLACLLRGATAICQSRFDAEALPHAIAAERVTVLAGAPTIFQALLDGSGAADAARTLRVAVTGAASVPPVLIERLRRDLAIPVVLTGYGLTEATGVVTMSSADDSAAVAATTAGRAVPGVEVACFAADDTLLPPGGEGEVRVRGYNVMRGYFEDAAATAAAIDRDGWLHTGDVGRLSADGCLQITDRLKDMYISGGFNCYPAEIERLLAAHPAIAQAAVIGIPDARLGEIGHAFVTLRPGAHAEAPALAEWARGAMANYKAPRVIDILPTLPLNPSGKVQKFMLRDRLAARQE